MSREPVESSSIRSIGYDPMSKMMEVEFNKGAVYVYEDVPEDVYHTLMTSESIGRAFSELIKSAGYTYELKG